MAFQSNFLTALQIMAIAMCVVSAGDVMQLLEIKRSSRRSRISRPGCLSGERH